MYSLAGYGQMIRDRIRTDAYAEALRATIHPQSVVLDIGAGTGIFALLACQFGARRVYAIETADAIEVGRAIASLNGLADRIVFIQDMSTRISLPEQADVIVSDLHGVLPLYAHHIPSIIDARERLLAPGGALIPQQEALRAAVVESPELYLDFTDAWDTERYGVSMEPARRLILNTWVKARPTPEQLLVEPSTWAVLDYRTITSPHVTGELTWTVQRDGIAHGVCLWFDTVLSGSIGFSNAPGAPPVLYGNAFFPLAEPVPVTAGDTVMINLRANLVVDNYVWVWQTRVLGQEGAEQVKANFNQSTAWGVPLSPAHLHRRAADYRPSLQEDGQVDQFILSLMDGARSVGEIAELAARRFPARFQTRHTALTYVADLSGKYSR